METPAPEQADELSLEIKSAWKDGMEDAGALPWLQKTIYQLVLTISIRATPRGFEKWQLRLHVRSLGDLCHDRRAMRRLQDMVSSLRSNACRFGIAYRSLPTWHLLLPFCLHLS